MKLSRVRRRRACGETLILFFFRNSPWRTAHDVFVSGLPLEPPGRASLSVKVSRTGMGTRWSISASKTFGSDERCRPITKPHHRSGRQVGCSRHWPQSKDWSTQSKTSGTIAGDGSLSASRVRSRGRAPASVTTFPLPRSDPVPLSERSPYLGSRHRYGGFSRASLARNPIHFFFEGMSDGPAMLGLPGPTDPLAS